MTILHETVAKIRAFTSKDVDYLHNSNLLNQLRRGENMASGTAEGAVLVKPNVDQCSYNAVEVDSHQDPADAIDAAIQSLVVIRNELRLRAAVA
jgi:hypothetical protein